MKGNILRMDRLPDEVIGHLFSFLPTKSLVRTSILSKQWRFLWTRLPSLGLMSIGHRAVEDSGSDSEMIKHFNNTSDDELMTWIDTIFSRSVRNIVILLNHQIQLHPRLFTCETVVEMCLVDCGYIPISNTIYLPALKKLRLVNVLYYIENSLTHLIFGCPLLEELIIDRMNLVYNSHPRLSRRIGLTMNPTTAMKLYKYPLRYLRFRAYMAMYISDFALGSLIEADIDLSEAQFSYPSELTEFVGNLRNVERLALSTPPMERVSSNFFPHWISNDEFHNLRELNIRADLRFITRFFESAHHIRILTIHSTVNGNTEQWMKPKKKPPCLVDCLETVNIVDFKWSAEHEFNMVRYILRNAEVMRRMEIKYTQHYEELDCNKKLEVLNKLERAVGLPSFQRLVRVVDMSTYL